MMLNVKERYRHRQVDSNLVSNDNAVLTTHNHAWLVSCWLFHCTDIISFTAVAKPAIQNIFFDEIEDYISFCVY